MDTSETRIPLLKAGANGPGRHAGDSNADSNPGGRGRSSPRRNSRAGPRHLRRRAADSRALNPLFRRESLCFRTICVEHDRAKPKQSRAGAIGRWLHWFITSVTALVLLLRAARARLISAQLQLPSLKGGEICSSIYPLSLTPRSQHHLDSLSRAKQRVSILVFLIIRYANSDTEYRR
jgi:hypothetical protein